MSLLESVKMALTKKRASARERYLESLRKGRSAEQIAAAATEAGISDEQVEADAATLEKAESLAAAAAEHPELKKKLADAVAKYASIEGEYAAAVATFTERLSEAGEEGETARAAETPARRALSELAALYRDHGGILPDAPPMVRALLEAQTHEEEIASSRAAVRQAKAAVAVVERRLLESRNDRHVPGIMSTISGFNQRTMQNETTTVRQPTLKGIDDVHVAGEQASIAKLETQLSEATATAARLADEHQKAFGELVP